MQSISSFSPNSNSGDSSDEYYLKYSEISNINENPRFSINLSSFSSNRTWHLINNITDLIKCNICLNRLRRAKMCKFCQHLACGECVRKSLEEINQCRICHHPISMFEFIEIHFIEDVQKLIDDYKFLEEKKVNLEKINQNLNQKLNFDKCNKHNEKALYYCSNCNKKLCGICTSIFNKETKIHEFHKVFEISEMDKTEYFDPINLLETAKEHILEENKYIKKCEEIKKDGGINAEEERYILNFIYKERENNYIKKNQIISCNSEKLINIQKQFDNKLKNITNKLQEIES